MRSVLYLLEGRDGTGKTTIAPLLAGRLGGRVLKTTSVPNHNDYRDEWIAAAALRAAQAAPAAIILDRGILSGLAYGDEFGLPSALEEWRAWREYLYEFDVTLVHLFCDAETRQQRDPGAMAADARLGVDLDELCWIVGCQPGVRYFRFNTDYIGPTAIVDMIARSVEDEGGPRA